MAKIFTITEGVENLGALKSGGQGSVYKARKTGEIITAIKILPTPIASESEDDKHFISFQNEVQKLKKVNEVFSPNVVSIIASGITSSGNLPYIEMEYIDGPDLGELLKPPHDAIFTIKESIKVAEQLANALAHCHRAKIKHGDIKSNNVKFNQRTGNYVLLDFGLSVMSDEQRRTSIRYAGAIEFMAPEQSSGETLFETDVYSFGIILFELLAGTVPFPLTNKSEMARNAVMLAHMESLPPDIISLRRDAMPFLWSNEKREREMQIPLWLQGMIYQCLEKDPAKRFKNGDALLEFIQSGIVTEEKTKTIAPAVTETETVKIDVSVWKKEILKLQSQLSEKDELLNDLRQQVQTKTQELYDTQYYYLSKPSGISKSLFVVVLIVAIGLAGFAAYHQLYDVKKTVPSLSIVPDTGVDSLKDSSAVFVKPAKKLKGKQKKAINLQAGNGNAQPEKNSGPDSGYQNENNTAVDNNTQYNITDTAYFYSTPNEKSKQNIYLTTGHASLDILYEKNNFIYVIVTRKEKTMKGWIHKNNVVDITGY